MTHRCGDRSVEPSRRVLVAQTYFDICEAYRLSPFLCHSAVELWDTVRHTSAGCNPGMDAACFGLVQKLFETSSFKVFEIAEIFGTTCANVLQSEKLAFPFLLKLESVNPARASWERTRHMHEELKNNVDSFFHLALIRNILLPRPIAHVLSFFLTTPSRIYFPSSHCPLPAPHRTAQSLAHKPRIHDRTRVRAHAGPAHTHTHTHTCSML